MTATSHRALRRGAQLLVMVAVAVVVVLLITMKGQPAAQSSSLTPTVASELPEVTLDRALAANQPTLAFFHSLTCESCVEMTAIVRQVYPEFQGLITLVDVNVYDERNQALVQRAKILGIPTLVLIDRTGQARTFAGVMEEDQLRQRLRSLAGGS